jgi:hypothetical protein
VPTALGATLFHLILVLPERHQLFIKRINYDPEMVNLLENSVIQFLGDVDLKIQQLESLP